MNSRGTQKFDGPSATLLSGGGLHYGQESIGGFPILCYAYLQEAVFKNNPSDHETQSI